MHIRDTRVMESTLARDSRHENAAEHMMLAVLMGGSDGIGLERPDGRLTRLWVPLLEIYDASPRSRHRVREYISAPTA